MSQPYPIPANISLLPRLDITPQLPLARTLTANQVPPRADLDDALASLASKPALLDAVANILAKTDAMRGLQPRAAQEPFMKMPDPSHHPVFARMVARRPNLFNYFGTPLDDAPSSLPPPVEKAAAPPKSKEPKTKEPKAVKVEPPPPKPEPPPPPPPKPEPPPVSVENGLKVSEKKKPQPKIPTAVIDPSLDAAQREAALVAARSRLEQLIRSVLEEVDGSEDLSRIDGLSSSSLRIKWKINAEGVKQICEEMLGAKSSGLISQLPLNLVKDLLMALRVQCYRGREDLDYTPDPSCNLRVCTSLDAVSSMLYILSSEGLPTEVYSEDTLNGIVLNLKHHLQRNVLVFYDKRLARQWRPDLFQEGQMGSEGKPKAKGPKFQPVSDKQLPKHLPLILGRIEQSLQLLSETLALIQMDTHTLMPFVRIAMQALTIDALHVFQVKVCYLSAAAFKYQPGVRGAILDELIVSILPTLQPLGAKNVPRHYLVQSVPGRLGVDGLGFTRGAAGGVVPIQMCVSLIMQLVQSAAELSTAGSSSLSSPGIQAVRLAYEKCRAPTHWADRFWFSLMDKLPSARATKADTSMDLKSFIEGIIQDLLAVSNLPEWPAASLLIRRLVAQLNSEKGLKHNEGSVRLMCVDFLGIIASRLVLDVKEAGEEEVLVHRLLRKSLNAIEGVRESDQLDDEGEEGDKMDIEMERLGDGEDEGEGEGAGSGRRRKRGLKEDAVGVKEKKQKVELSWPPHSTEVLQQLLISFLSKKPSTPSPPSFLLSTASSLIASQMLCDRLGEEIKAKRLDLIPTPSVSKAGPTEGESDNQRKAEDLILLYRSLLSSPGMGRILTPPSTPLGSLPPPPSTSLELSSHPYGKKGGRGKGHASHETYVPSSYHPPSSSSYPLPSITREEAAAICRWLMANSSLGKRRGMLLKWLIDAGDKTKQDGGGAANVRAKAIKCIGSAIDVDVRVLGLPDVQGAVRMALQDESVMVREAAVELIGR